MMECVVNMLVQKYQLKRDVAFIFYIDVLNVHKINELIQHLNEFDCFEALKSHFLGGK